MTSLNLAADDSFIDKPGQDGGLAGDPNPADDPEEEEMLDDDDVEADEFVGVPSDQLEDESSHPPQHWKLPPVPQPPPPTAPMTVPLDKPGLDGGTIG